VVLVLVVVEVVEVLEVVVLGSGSHGSLIYMT
jgi:hypothetical protein